MGKSTVFNRLTSIAVNRLAFKGAHTAFIMEMPLCHMPNARTIGLFAWYKSCAQRGSLGEL
jgi:Fe2+ transport system protein B